MKLKDGKIIDMHTHSCFSDGNLTPEELVSYASKHNIGIMSLTDHDTILGLQDLDTNLKQDENNPIIIPGIELTAKVDHGRMHILGYGINIHDPKLNDKLLELHDNSINSVLAYAYQLEKDYGISFSKEDVDEIITSKRNIGRPDLAVLCVKYGYADSVDDAFNKYLRSVYKKIRGDNPGINFEECLSIIKKSGGISVIAHPHSLELNNLQLLRLLRDMISCGLDGIEVYHPHHTDNQTQDYMELAENLNLLYSGGSDFHGSIAKPDVEIGTGINNNICIKKLTLLNHL
jgi:predicted metal-dependent phosphoesterase TrpH